MRAMGVSWSQSPVEEDGGTGIAPTADTKNTDVYGLLVACALKATALPSERPMYL